VRDLGPVKGGKGMKHHEVIIDFNRRGMVTLVKRLLTRPQRAELTRLHDLQETSR